MFQRTICASRATGHRANSAMRPALVPTPHLTYVAIALDLALGACRASDGKKRFGQRVGRFLLAAFLSSGVRLRIIASSPPQVLLSAWLMLSKECKKLVLTCAFLGLGTDQCSVLVKQFLEKSRVDVEYCKWVVSFASELSWMGDARLHGGVAIAGEAEAVSAFKAAFSDERPDLCHVRSLLNTHGADCLVCHAESRGLWSDLPAAVGHPSDTARTLDNEPQRAALAALARAGSAGAWCNEEA